MVNCFGKYFLVFEKSLFCVQSTIDGCHQHFQRKKQNQKTYSSVFALTEILVFVKQTHYLAQIPL